MNILYLHGYQSLLHQDRRLLLEQYGTVHGPSLNYDNPKDLFFTIQNLGLSFDCIVGSSAGGLLGFYFSYIYNIPSLLFNPALEYFEDYIHTGLPLLKDNVYQKIILGCKDDIINPKKSLAFLSKFDASKMNYDIKEIKELSHSIPIETFKNECVLFFKESII